MFSDFDRFLIIDNKMVEQFVYTYFPHATTILEMKAPTISSLYKNFRKLRGKLPHGFFVVGTEDPLLDDTSFMAAK